ncbi:hypothetical protein TrLO_g14802 [Triparma laevis f. longispina]|uniref:DAGKc domain-containing protein n=1 Tax=Triparma laevis f. longispina TaxID=1714387 RepID=A0A9W7L040_9STRA|nr:hypothetical protein TrLO_g14802 [Triparma laevis f. longispina]
MSSVHNQNGLASPASWPDACNSLKFSQSSDGTDSTSSHLALDVQSNSLTLSGSPDVVIGLGDCLGASIHPSGLLSIYCYPMTKPKCGSSATKARIRAPSPISLQLENTSGDATKFSSDIALCDSTLVPAIRRLCTGSGVGERRRKFLVLVNPFSGKKQGNQICETFVKPMFEHANIEPVVLVTERAGHATDLMKNDSGTDLYQYDAIIAVGGDGLLYEMMQGAQLRSDKAEFFDRVAFGIVPAGSGNGLAASVSHGCDEFDATITNVFVICKGEAKKSDLSLYQTAAGNSYTSFLSLSWGIVADVDLESEVLRALGSMRFDVYAVWRMIALKQYRAKLSYLPAGVEIGAMPPIDQPVDGNWTTIEDNFLCFWALQTTHASQGMFTSPASRMNDGKFHIYVVRGKASRLNLLTSFLAFEDGSHVKQKHMEIIECTAFRLEPLSDNSHLDIDGEEVEYGAIQAQVQAGAWKVFY